MSENWIDDFFGRVAARPDHPDMMRISEVLLGLDAGFDPATQSEEQQEEAWQALVKEVGIDPKVASYAAIQRAMRILNITEPAALRAQMQLVMKLTSAWLDGFMVGAAYRDKVRDA